MSHLPFLIPLPTRAARTSRSTHTLACGARFVLPREDIHKENPMNQIVKAETAPTMSQATTSASVLIALTALIVSPALLSIARTRA